MPRTLPWARETQPRPKPAKRKRADSQVQKEIPRSSSPILDAAPAGPPPVEYMRPGDEEWRMVEDEFLATAQTFTRHIHHAEYERLMQKHKQPIGRSTVEKPESKTKATVLKQEYEIEESEYFDDLHLAGLMADAPKSDLHIRARVRPKTKAAAGYIRSQPQKYRPEEATVREAVEEKVEAIVEEDSSETDDGDLDLTPRKPPKSPKQAKPNVAPTLDVPRSLP
ncbi:hypothetical protein K470DRAFT_271797 [Piedraia hortae CBS 480.64]|uniref:Uncharacterized protein n=1 Tax=Piedraia hortae CBS 480.64 TaxID=1314780 RepID=A0A6A7BVK3_9PEZI|nr:hypothetical protein K470DRAFT_271797 [Piedraia hortae CBS 480.64]